MFVIHFFDCNVSSKNLLSLFLQKIRQPVLFSCKLITFNSNWSTNLPGGVVKHVRLIEVPDYEARVSCMNILKTLDFLEKKILRLSTEVLDGETTVSCTNLLETLSFLRETILQYFSHDNCVMKVVLEWK